MATLMFPRDFLWGAATSSYQIEGAWDADGRGESIWDRFSHTPGNILDGTNGDVACDHYHRWRDDIALMKRLGVRAYRFSLAWPRILPQGRGQVNQRGLDFYRRLVDELRANDIEPYATIYHWDLPQVLQDAGGWPARATAEAFVAYADVVSRALGDQVASWATHNEPWVASFLGYELGIHAPGHKSTPEALAAAHHVLLSHGWAVPIIRRNSPSASVGIVLNLTSAHPATPSEADVAAARHHDGYLNRWFLDPVFTGAYPADMVAAYTEAGHVPASGLPFVQAGDMETISVPIDFLGINYYTRALVSAAGASGPFAPLPEGVEKTDLGWEVYPQGLEEVLTRVATDYNPPNIYITENGAAYSDGPSADGAVHDERRIAYLRGHFAAMQRAIAAGVPLAGYFVWSLMDNFEWSFGYSQRFGIVWVDYDTQQRILKNSALWYRDVIAANAVTTDDE